MIQGSYDRFYSPRSLKKNGALSKKPKKRHSIIESTYIVFEIRERLKFIPPSQLFSSSYLLGMVLK